MNLNKSGFTLIELIVAITIVISLMIVTYVPYNHYQNKAKLKLASREISQSFYEARNMATSGLKDSVGNRSIGVYIQTISPNDDSLVFFSYPYDVEETNIQNIEIGDIKIIKTKKLQNGIKFDDLGGFNNLLFFYESITGKSSIYNFSSGGKNLLSEDEIPITFSYKNSTSSTLRTQLIYFTKTNIVDYK